MTGLGCSGECLHRWRLIWFLRSPNLAIKLMDVYLFLFLELRHAFTLCDKDSDGVISIQELGTLMGRLGHNTKEVELREMVFQIHPDGLHTSSRSEREFGLSFDDFLSIMFFSLRGSKDLDAEGHDTEAMLRETFRYIMLIIHELEAFNSYICIILYG